MKKNNIILLTLVILLFALSACGNKEKDSKDSIEDGKQSQEQEHNINSSKENSDEKELSDILTGTYQVPLTNFYVNTPPYNMIESGYSRLFMMNDSKYAAFTFLYREKGTTPTDAMDTTFAALKDNLRGYHQVNFINEDMEAQDVDINGISTYNIKGTVNCGTDNKYDAYIYGYAFVFEGMPCSIIGIVEDKAQAQEDINEITEIVDAMMKSVRNEK